MTLRSPHHLVLILLIGVLSPQTWAYMGKPDSCLYGHALMFTGTEENSFQGTTGFGLGFTSGVGGSIFKWVFGGEFIYASALAQIDSTEYSAAIYGTDFLTGFRITPVPDSLITPMIEILGVAGIKSVQISDPPANSSNPSVAFSLGYKINVGADLKAGQSTVIRAFGSYVSASASKVGPKSNYNVGGFGLAIGFTF